MKLLSFELPGLSGAMRGLGKIGGAADVEVAVDSGGEGRIGWRKPPGACCRSEADVMF